MTDRTNSVVAAEELLKRRSTRKSFAEWAKHKGFEPAAHHRLIIKEIESFLESDDEGFVTIRGGDPIEIPDDQRELAMELAGTCPESAIVVTDC